MLSLFKLLVWKVDKLKIITKGVILKPIDADSFFETLEKMVGGEDNKTVYMPYEATGVLSSLGGIKELLNK